MALRPDTRTPPPAAFRPEFAADFERRLREAGDRLTTAQEVPPGVDRLLTQVADALLAARPEVELASVDPYLVLALQRGALACLRGLADPNVRLRRRMVRVGMEQMRQALRDIGEVLPVGEDRPAKQVARWLADVVDVPQSSLAEVVGTSTRTFQRWVSAAEAVRPTGEEARRLRVVARIASNLRHALSGPGVVRWFTRPHPDLAGATPASLLGDPLALERLMRLASRARSATAS
ncbi:MAG: hypothetical protein HY775_02125 [Acidobacteria bacterium]|nr:hypothetical protein [Acidobacteriota bacterium]